ncbi:hypothetical protein [Bacillus suaedae]|uniref:Uncharacterized protein n=1 Tax=Halalkalibacter suaedae TaxID=2822140 RepID=A0A940WXR4_9BACI|nr:hypothetical protein [Bacillus suaedae]MBP3950226.1 hypothetical protein [Bacillus suaedae]
MRDEPLREQVGGNMSLARQIIVVLFIYAGFALIIEVLLWHFNPPLNEFFRIAIKAFPVLITLILSRILVKKAKTKGEGYC